MAERAGNRGMSLVEILVASALLSVVILAVARVFSNSVVSIEKSREITRAAAVAQMIDVGIKSMPFHDIFSYDSSRPNVNNPPDPAVAVQYNPETLLIPLNLSRSSHTLIAFQNEVTRAGFSHFTVTVTFLRRDSSAQTNSSGVVENFVPWYSYLWDRCDDVDTELCFRECDGINGYFGFCPDTKPEVPDTGLKQVTVAVHKNGQRVAVTHASLITKSGLTGKETPTGQAPLKLVVTFPPKKRYFFFQARSDLVPHLEYRSIYDYPSDYLGWTGSAVRIDDYPRDVTLYQNESGHPAPQTIHQGGESHFRLEGWTEPGADLSLWAWTSLGLWTNTTLTDPADQMVPGGAGPNGTFLLNDGLGPLSARLTQVPPATGWNLREKVIVRASNGNLKSPADWRDEFIIDDQPPRALDWGPQGNCHSLSPLIWTAARDNLSESFGLELLTFRVWEGSSGTPLFTVSDPIDRAGRREDGLMMLFDSGASGHYVTATQYNEDVVPNPWPYRTKWEMVTQEANGLPPVLNAGTTYRVLFEVGDVNMYKTSHTWTFTTPTHAEIAADATPPTITLPEGSGAFSGQGTSSGNEFPWHDPTHQSTWTLRTAGIGSKTLSFKNIRLSDPETGIKYTTFKMELCQADLSGCATFYDRNYGPSWNLVTHTLRPMAWATLPTVDIDCFPTRHVRIRTSVANWNNQTAVKDDWYIYVSTGP